MPIDGNTSDGFHTFNELYEHRHALFAVICATYPSWKSKLHDDGSMFEGWFIAGVNTAEGHATYHMPLSWWDRFRCEELERAPEWDGHTPADVIRRVQSLRTDRAEIERQTTRRAYEKIADLIAEFGDDPKAALSIIGEWVGETLHAIGRAK